jgi:hypothetical protein
LSLGWVLSFLSDSFIFALTLLLPYILGLPRGFAFRGLSYTNCDPFLCEFSLVFWRSVVGLLSSCLASLSFWLDAKTTVALVLSGLFWVDFPSYWEITILTDCVSTSSVVLPLTPWSLAFGKVLDVLPMFSSYVCSSPLSSLK